MATKPRLPAASSEQAADKAGQMATKRLLPTRTCCIIGASRRQGRADGNETAATARGGYGRQAGMDQAYVQGLRNTKAMLDEGIFSEQE